MTEESKTVYMRAIEHKTASYTALITYQGPIMSDFELKQCQTSRFVTMAYAYHKWYYPINIVCLGAVC